MRIDVSPGAQDDLAALLGSDPEAWKSVMATLEQMQADPALVDKLTTHRSDQEFGESRVNVKQWQSALRKERANLWRFRVLDTPATNYRVVYGYHYQTRQICLFAVVVKEDFDYEPTSDLGRRILAEWSQL